jgi:hypothetical protein
MREKRNELVRRAAGKAADAALEQTKKAALGAADSVGQALERALFGDVVPSEDEPAPADRPAQADPFARLKAKERAEQQARATPRAQVEREREREREVEADLRALKKRLEK